MPDEIERKYLVKNDDWRSQVMTRRLLDQAYLLTDPDCTIRVRIIEDEAFLTIKGRKVNASAPEYEYPVPRADAEDMLARLPIMGRLRKYRHEVIHAGHRWEVDEFLEANAGLILAELELQSEDERFEMPSWIAEEVTGDSRYSNSNLVTVPFGSW